VAAETEAAAAEQPSTPGPTRVPWVVIGTLLVLMVAAGIATTKSKTPPVKTEGSRAIVLPPADRTRTVVVPPCSPPTVITAANASSQIDVPGTVAVSLPQGAPARTVVIPRCSATAAPSPGSPIIASAAFVLGPGEQVSDVQSTKAADPIASGIKAQVTVPTGSPVTTIVAAPCQGKSSSARTTVLNPLAGSGVAIAPTC
jgi:hypothetical protein